MKFKNGCVDVTELLGIEVPKLEEWEEFDFLYESLKKNPNVNILKYKAGVTFVFNFKYGNETYYFKYNSLELPEDELFANEIARDAHIPFVEYWIATLGCVRGCISKSYKDKNENTKYVDGTDVLVEANKEAVGITPDDDEDFIEMKIRAFIRDHYSLEDIWLALEDRYKDRSDKQEIVKRVMRRLIDRFIMSILIRASDINSTNWQIVEYEDGFVNMVPVYDFSRIFNGIPEMSRLSLVVESKSIFEDIYNSDLERNLEKYIKFSSKEFRDILIERLWILSEENVEEIIRRIDSKMHYTLAPKIAREYKHRCSEQLEYLLESLGLKSVPRFKIVDLETLINWEDLKNSRMRNYAGTIMSPSQILHIVPLDGNLTGHEELFDEVCRCLFDNPEGKINSLVRVRYTLDEGLKEVFVEAPKYITTSEYEELVRIRDFFNSKYFGVSGEIGIFDPILNDQSDGKYVYLEEEELLKYLKDNGRVVDYDLPFEGEKTLKNEEIRLSL